MKQLRKSNKKILTGVCGGLAEFFKIDPTIVRLIVCLIVIFTKGIGLILYVVASIVMPAPELSDDDIDNLKSANCDDDNYTQKDSSGQGKNESEEQSAVPHTNEEFDKFFKK